MKKTIITRYGTVQLQNALAYFHEAASPNDQAKLKGVIQKIKYDTKDKALILKALTFKYKSAMKDDVIKKACYNDKKFYAPLLRNKEKSLKTLKQLIYVFKK